MLTEKNNTSPEHIPPVNYDLSEIEKQKESVRKIRDKLKKQGKKPEPVIITESGEAKKAIDLNVEEQTQQIIKCASDPIYFIETYLTIFDQTKGDGGELVPFKLFDFQKKLINGYLENRFVVANKYRQAGISTATCAYIAWYIMFKENRSVAIVANKLETARDEMMTDVVDFIEGCPKWLRPNPDVKNTQKLKRYDNGCELGAFSSKGLRGYTPTLLFWDETAWTEKGDVFWTAAKPTLQTGGRAIMVSCVTKDSYIYTDRGIKQVKDFIKTEELGPQLIEDSYIGGLDKTRKTNIMLNNGYVDTYKIKTKYSEIETSENHKFWTYKDGQYKWVKAKDLDINNYVSINYNLDIWGDNDDCSDFKPTESVYIKNKFKPTKITEDIAYLLGLFIAEGYGCFKYRKNKIKTFVFTLTCGDDLSHVFKTHNLNYHFDGIHYSSSSKNLGEFLEYLGFDFSKKAKHKIIPPRLLEMSKKNIIALIQGIMDGDGYTSHNMSGVGISLASRELINQLRILLGNFGILTVYSERFVRPTKKVKSSSYTYTIIANGSQGIKYYNKIGFRFKRKVNNGLDYDLKNIQCVGKNNDLIPNGGEILYEEYTKIKKKNIFKELLEHDINIEPYVTERKYKNKPINRHNLLKLLKYTGNGDEYNHIINENIVWTKIKDIEKSKNWTYDFSMSDENPIEPDEFNMQITYNQFITHNTPQGHDSVFYKTFQAARRGENNFKAIELWWFNDPRYNEGLEWIKNKGKENEIRMKDEGWTEEHRIKLQDDGWEATSPWFEEEVRNANGDMRKIAQELLCVFKDTLITVRNKKTGIIENMRIDDFYKMLEEENTY